MDEITEMSRDSCLSEMMLEMDSETDRDERFGETKDSEREGVGERECVGEEGGKENLAISSVQIRKCCDVCSLCMDVLFDLCLIRWRSETERGRRVLLCEKGGR